MTALDLLQLLTNLTFVAIFAVVAIVAIRRPTVANVDAALFFTILAGVIALGRVTALLGIAPSPLQSAVSAILAMTLPFLLLRLADDLIGVPRSVIRVATAGLLATFVLIGLSPTPLPAPVTLGLGAYFAFFTIYSARAFIRAAASTRGVTRRRMEAVALGSFLLGAVIVIAIVPTVLPGARGLLAGATSALTLAAALSYFIGFVTPRFFRRAWQDEELRDFFGEAARLPRLPTTAEIVRCLEEGAAAATGATASVGLWDEERRMLVFGDPNGGAVDVSPAETLTGRVLAEQRAIFIGDLPRAEPKRAEIYRRQGVIAGIGAPITAGDRRLGVLVVHARRAPIFAEDDVALVKLLADQAAVVLESRALIDEATRVQAHAEANRLKEDFLSAAAHDLKTPLTSIVAQAQSLAFRVSQRPDLASEMPGIQRMVGEADRLRGLVTKLLDAVRLERGELVEVREPVDLGPILEQLSARTDGRVSLEREGDLRTHGDPERLGQLFANLIENAVKYGEERQARITAGRADATIKVSVRDEGIGIPAEDLPHIFERFRRGANVDHRRHSGLGLGLYLAKGIVDQHGGRIWAESAPGSGTTMRVELPALRREGR